MDSKNVKDGQLGNVLLESFAMCRQVKDIPGASIDGSDNVVLDLSKWGPSAEVVLARVGAELATITQTAGDSAELDFASAATAASFLELFVKIPLGE